MAKGITLIGMPGAGKSTVGRLLAEKIKFSFVDLDNLIRDRKGKTHTQIASEEGDAELLRLEEFYTLGLNLQETVFAPGGSIVYSPMAMEKVCRETSVIYLAASIDVIRKNLGEKIEERGIVGLQEKGLAGIFAERAPLYDRYAHYKIDCAGKDPQAIVELAYSLIV